jgi:hypothetical protein
MKAAQRNYSIRAGGLGLNGLIVEGSPGIGKSALVVDILSQLPEARWQKIDASLSLKSICDRLSQAMHQGQLVLFEELNCHVDGLLEKYLNLALTGIDPKTGEMIDCAGFGLIVTINGAHMEGRECLSPALLGRCQYVSMAQPDVSDVIALLSHHDGGANHDVRVLAQVLIDVMKEKRLSFRDIVPVMGKLQLPMAPCPRSML